MRQWHVQAAVRWSRQDGKKASWLHVQFESEDSVDNACQLSGQAMMGRELFVERASEGQAQDKPLNMGQAVKDCWFCLSNDQVQVLVACLFVYISLLVVNACSAHAFAPFHSNTALSHAGCELECIFF